MPEPVVAPNELSYTPEVYRSESSAIAFALFFLPCTAAVFVGAIDPECALPAGAAVALVLWLRRKPGREPAIVLRVAEDRLVITGQARKVLLDEALSDICDVGLDTKTISKVKENLSSGIPELRFVDSVVGPEQDVSRIEFVLEDTEICLTERFTSNTDATEWLTKIRRFLRSHGWRPWEEDAEPPRT